MLRHGLAALAAGLALASPALAADATVGASGNTFTPGAVTVNVEGHDRRHRRRLPQRQVGDREQAEMAASFTLRFEVTLADGRAVKGSRRFKPCGR